MVLARILLLRRADEPRAAVCDGAVLAPRAEVVPAADGLPAGAHVGEVELAEEERLGFAPQAVAEVGFVDVAVVQAEAFFVKADGSG